jgi:hypothetical protein
MTDIVERLNHLGADSVGNYGMPIAVEAAEAIEFLRQQLAECQALNLKLRGDIASYIAMDQGEDAAANYVASYIAWQRN